MSHTRVFVKRMVSPDGKVIAEAKSVVTISGDQESTIDQTVSVNISSDSNSFSCSSSSVASVVISKRR